MVIQQSIGFDVYGTLVDPVDMGKHLAQLIGDKANAFGQLWHDKKVEYAFRRALMQQYADFSVCTLQALRYCMLAFNIELTEDEQHHLVSEFANLDAFDDVIPGLIKLRQKNHRLAAFSNGPEVAVRKLLSNASVLPHLDSVISVDDLNTYKPNPQVYQYLMKRTHANTENSWMVSSNPWDVIGGKAAGLKAAWIKRDPRKIFDPWDIEPDLIVNNLIEFSEQIDA
jgi:2-haloacid dehalogenase